MVRSIALSILFWGAVSTEVFSSCDSSQSCAGVAGQTPAMLQVRNEGAVVQNDFEEAPTPSAMLQVRHEPISHEPEPYVYCGNWKWIYWGGSGRIHSKVYDIGKDMDPSWGQGCRNCIDFIKRQGYICSANTRCDQSIWGVWLKSDNCWKTSSPTPSPTLKPYTCCALNLNNLNTPHRLVDPSVNKFVTHSSDERLRFSNVCTTGGISWDLELTLVANYTGKPSQNKVVDNMFQLNLKQGTRLWVGFHLLPSGQEYADMLNDIDEISFSVLDLDQQPGVKQSISLDGFYEEKHGSKVTKTKYANSTVCSFTSERDGTLADNPVDPMHLSEAAKSSTVSVKYKGLDWWFMGLRVGGSAESGRNFMIGGATELMPSTCE